MKKLKPCLFLILLSIFTILSSNNLMAQLTESPFMNLDSISYPFSNWNNWNNFSFRSPYWGCGLLNFPFSSLYWSSGLLSSPFSKSYLSTSTSQLNLPWDIPSFEINTSSSAVNSSNLRNGLWYWPATPPDWVFYLNSQGLDYESLNSGDPETKNPLPTEADFIQLWQKISEAIEDGLPRTAIEHLKKMIPMSIKCEKYGLAMKAICKQLVLEANIQGDKPEEKIRRLTEEIEKAPELLKPLLNIVLAQWYWEYYQNNRWRFSQRDTTANIFDTDFTTWDLPRLFNKIDELYTNVLAQEEQLKSTSMEIFNDFFTLGNVPLSYRPTLFDFVAFSAISFYQDGDQLRKSPEESFELEADSDAFAPAEIFIQYSPETTDISSPLLKAMKLYQKLLNFHLNDLSKEAFVDTDINRLIFIKAYSVGEEKTNRYLARLSEIAQTCTIASLSSLAYYYWAEELYNQNNYLEAHTIAQKGVDRDPESYGGKMCRSLLTRIEAKYMDLESEYALTSQFQEVKLDYKNITRIHLRVVEYQWDDFLVERNGYPGDISSTKFQELLQKTPVESWSVALEPTTDYRTHSQIIDLPTLQPGYYTLIASWREDFAKQENSINMVSFWITEIAMVTKEIGGQLECYILDAQQGAPLQGAKVTAFLRNEEGWYHESAVGYTNGNGSFTISNNIQKKFILHAQYNDYEIVNEPIRTSLPRQEPAERKSTIFFTDRSIYRPEQMIHFKVLAIKSNQAGDTYNFLPNTPLTITFRDHNYQEVDHLDLVTNAFGSASGTFTAPSGQLTGAMTISCNQLDGSTSIRVEEYKRPKFKVELNPPQEEGRLDEEIELQGQAMAYSGAAIDGANVSYRVTREVSNYSSLWGAGYYYGSSNTVEIAHGLVSTDTEGKFSLRFIARPDRSIPKSNQPTFIYKVSVDVTDGTGETRSKSLSIQVGYVSMSLNIYIVGQDSSASPLPYYGYGYGGNNSSLYPYGGYSSDYSGDWLTNEKPIKFGISAMTLNQQPLNTSGTITIYTLKQPQEPVRPSQPVSTSYQSYWEAWPEDQAIATSQFNTSEGSSQIEFALGPGVYRAIAKAYDAYGEEAVAMLPIMVIDPSATRFTVPIPNLVKVRSTTLEVGDKLEAIWGTGYQEGHALIEIEHRGKIVNKYWTNPQNTQQKIEWTVGEAHRGGFSLHVTQVHDNRVYISNQNISVPWSNKELEVSFSTFRSKLDPGAEETWTIQIKGPKAENVAAELTATLYDASLDAFLSHYWSGLGGIFRQDYSSLSTEFANRENYSEDRTYDWNDTYSYAIDRTYTRFPDDIVQEYSSYRNYYGYGESTYGGVSYGYSGNSLDSSAMYGASMYGAYGSGTLYGSSSEDKSAEFTTPTEAIDLAQVSARTNFNETAFFLPHLLTNGDGQVSITFTIPETLTTWKFMGFAHSQNLLSGLISEEAVTQKNLMVQPNPPRFLREGDTILFSAKVTNLSDQEQSGTIRLSLSNTLSEQSLDAEFLSSLTDQPFSVPAKSSRSFYWEIKVPDYSGVLTYKVVASSGNLSDGEEDALPVLSRRIFVTESLPLPIRGPQTKTFSFDKLLASDQSETLTHQALTLQMVSNPAWYAVQSLPYLMESNYECSEQIFNRLYANALAGHIANSDTEIKQIFSQWQGTEALESNLEKNEELKSVLLEETPWVRAAESESESKKRVGLLFDDEQVSNSLSSAYDKLAGMQLSNGAWPWFPGGQSDYYITLYIMTGFGRLRHMNVDVNQELALKCLEYVDGWVYHTYEHLKRQGYLAQCNLSSTIALYLYGRSFYLDTKPIPVDYQTAVNYFLGQASYYWLDFSSRLSQGHLALACQRFNDQITAQKIMASLKERSVSDEEMGMYWRDLEFSWWWYSAPIETQAVMIEAFDEVADDQTSVEDLKVWLLLQKQTQNWKTTKSTADAVYALLLRGANLLSSDELVAVTLGNLEIIPEDIEAGTGFYEKKFTLEEVKADYGQIIIEKVEQGVGWGSLHWQYLEDMSKVTPHQTPLQLEKALYVERQSNEGPVIEPVTGDLAMGDLIIVRVILRVDRDMEYVHMKDYRGSGTEPLNVLSQYKYQDGLAYYESTKDTATHFFINYLPKGTYVFEYPLRIQHKGEYQMGLATIECMYAPEFNSHSESIFITVK